MVESIQFSTKKNKHFSIISAYVFFLSPICEKLVIGSVTVSQILLLLLLVYALVTNRVKFQLVNRELALVFIIVSLQSLYSYVVTANSAVLHRWMASVFYFILVFLYPSFIENNSFYKAYRNVSVVVLLGLLYHLFCIYVMHSPVNPITFFPSLLGHSAVDIDRPMSFFSEPSHLAVFLFPLLFVATINRDRKWVMISLISLLMSTSFLGIAMAAVILVSSLFTGVNKRGRLIYMILIIISLYAVLHLPFFDFIFYRGDMMLNGEEGSAMQRTFWGLELIKQLDHHHFLFGIGAGNQDAFFKVEGEGIFYNSLFGLVIDYGIIIASILFILLFILLPKGQNRNAKIFVLLILILISSSSVYFTSNFFFIYTIFFLIADKRVLKWIRL